jgi:hypothetical protein
MQVFLFDNHSVLNHWFNEPDHKIPFLATDFLAFNTLGILRTARDNGDEVRIHIPYHWYDSVDNRSLFSPYDGQSFWETLQNNQSQEYELVFSLPLTSLFVGDLDRADIAHLKQNPEKLFMNRGVMGGYLKKGQGFPAPENFHGFDAFIPVTQENFLRLNQDLVAQMSVRSLETTARTYGKPMILSEHISSDSTICSPCYIGKDVVINQSYIGPGSVIRSGSIITNSKIYGSFIEGSRVTNSELTDTITSSSVIEGVTLQNSVVPSWSDIINVR